MFRARHAFLSAHCSLVVTCWEKLATWLSCILCLIVFVSLSHVMIWVRCATWLYRFLIFASLLTLIYYLTVLDYLLGKNSTRQHRRRIWILEIISLFELFLCLFLQHDSCLLTVSDLVSFKAKRWPTFAMSLLCEHASRGKYQLYLDKIFVVSAQMLMPLIMLLQSNN